MVVALMGMFACIAAPARADLPAPIYSESPSSHGIVPAYHSEMFDPAPTTTPTKFTVTVTAASPMWSLEPTLSYDIFAAYDVLGKKGFEVHLWGLGATDATTGQPLGGFGLVAPFKVALNVTLWLGPRFTLESGQDPIFGVVIGIEALKF